MPSSKLHSSPGMTNYHIGQHRATSEHIGQHRITWDRIGPLRTTWDYMRLPHRTFRNN